MNKNVLSLIITMCMCSSVNAMSTKATEATEKLFEIINSEDIYKRDISGQIKELIKQGADVNSKKGFIEATPLMRALSRWHQRGIDDGRIFKLLIDPKNINEQDVMGLTALMHASLNPAVKSSVIKLLLQSGANKHTRTGKETALSFAIAKKDDLFRLLDNPNFSDKKEIKLSVQNQNEKIMLLEMFD